MGYHKAGFDIVGVDINKQPRYPFDFVRADALAIAESYLAWGDYDMVHASPPCWAFSDLKNLTDRIYPDLLTPTRELLKKVGIPYIIENVDSAPMENSIRLCGTQFPGLRVFRHRLFESNMPIEGLPHEKHKVKVYTYDRRKPQFGQPLTEDSFVQVTGGGNAPLDVKHKAMGIDWKMRAREINQAIPPAYTEFLGKQMLQWL